ncbi:MAG TPA: hypothetical protein VLV31_04100 [Candidatus Acidoferrales bacterium]|nr:hypothetical protein [Candidatus Acidoferrales bacterium]
MAMLVSAEAEIDPLTEHDNLTVELVNLETQFTDRTVQEKEFQRLSNEVR